MSPPWLVEHCIGPLGLGSLIVKPERHVTAVAELSDEEVEELGPLLRRTSGVAAAPVEAVQVYNCLWSHAGGVPVHIHYVVQPVTPQQMELFGLDGFGPALQLAMFRDGTTPDPEAIEQTANRARELFERKP